MSIARFQTALERLQLDAEVFRCPACHQPLVLAEHAGWYLMCQQSHSFPIARDGFVEFTSGRRGRSGYTARRLDAWRTLHASGLFDPLVSFIGEYIVRNPCAGPEARQGALVDIGCGDGWLVTRLAEALRVSGIGLPLAVGMDLSREGIRHAARQDSAVLWAVADGRRRFPLARQSATWLLNVLAPTNAHGIRRVLASGGRAIIVKRMEHHWVELRAALADNPWESPYPNYAALRSIAKRLAIVERHRLTYTVPVSHGTTLALMGASSLTAHANRRKIMKLRDEGLASLTCDLLVLVVKRPAMKPHAPV